MSCLKILVADDQIPDQNLPDDKITDESKKLLSIIKDLEIANYHVTAVNKFKDAMEKVKNSTFDIAIIDMGWQYDEDIPVKHDRESAGWKIINVIKNSDKRLKSKNKRFKNTFLIMFSRQFEINEDLSSDAARWGILPFYKDLTSEYGTKPLCAAVRFIERHLGSQDVEDRDRMTEEWREKFKQEKLWFYLMLGFLTMSLSLLILGFFGAIFHLWDVQVSTITTIGGCVASLFSGIFVYKQKIFGKK